MSGLDFSPPRSRSLGTWRPRGADIDFHVADVYDAVEVLGAGGYDLVFTGVGALGWLPDIDRWGRSWPRCCGPAAGCSCARATRCCGRWPIPGPTGWWSIEYPYFTQVEPTVWDEEGTYVTSDVAFSTPSRTSGTTGSARS